MPATIKIEPFPENPLLQAARRFTADHPEMPTLAFSHALFPAITETPTLAFSDAQLPAFTDPPKLAFPETLKPAFTDAPKLPFGETLRPTEDTVGQLRRVVATKDRRIETLEARCRQLELERESLTAQLEIERHNELPQKSLSGGWLLD